MRAIPRRFHFGERGYTYALSAVELASALEMRQAVFATILPIDFDGQLIVTDTYLRRWIASAAATGASNLEQLALVYQTIPLPRISIHISTSVEVAFDRLSSRRKGDHVLRDGGIARLRRLDDGYQVADRLLGYEAVTVSGEWTLLETAEAIRESVVAAARDSAPESLYRRLIA